MQAGDGGGETLRVLEWIASAVGGALTGAMVAVVTFRTKLALLEQRLSDVERDRGRDRQHLETELSRRDTVVDERLDTIDKRQLITLRILADMARKLGVESRIFDDAVVRFINAENEG